MFFILNRRRFRISCIRPKKVGMSMVVAAKWFNIAARLNILGKNLGLFYDVEDRSSLYWLVVSLSSDSPESIGCSQVLSHYSNKMATFEEQAMTLEDEVQETLEELRRASSTYMLRLVSPFVLQCYYFIKCNFID